MIDPMDQIAALQKAQELLLRGMWCGIPMIDEKLQHARAHLQKEANALALIQVGEGVAA